MATVTSNAIMGSAMGNPATTKPRPTMTPMETKASERVWAASAARISLLSRLPARRSYKVTNRFTTRVPTMTMKDTGVT